MPRGRDRDFLDAMELWNPRPTTFGVSSTAYFTIARIFKQIDRAMLYVMQDDILWHTQPIDGPTQLPTSGSRFNDLRAHKDRESYVGVINQGISQTSSETDIIAYLTDTR